MVTLLASADISQGRTTKAVKKAEKKSRDRANRVFDAANEIVDNCLEEVRDWKVYSRRGWGSQIGEPKDRSGDRSSLRKKLTEAHSSC
jgi:hypothetical protein